jgi:uncharacterized protein (TIGR02996 family)
MSVTPGHEPFLRAICDAPDDDAPRLVFADWLDENGDPDRAEFIRKHVQLARNPDVVNIERRCEELFGANGRKWVTELPGTAALWAAFDVGHVARPRAVRRQVTDDDGPVDTWIECSPELRDWNRGFPATIYVQGSGDVFFDVLGRVAELVPVIRLRLMHLSNMDAVAISLANSPFLRRLRELIVPWGRLTDAAVMALANSQFATELRAVYLNAGDLSYRAARALAESPSLNKIEVLHLLHGHINDADRAQLRARFGFAVHC